MSRPSSAKQKKRGSALITTMIIVGMVTLSVALYYSWLAVFSVNGSVDHKKSGQARYLADTCAEIALQRIWNDSNFIGSGNYSGYGGSCTYVVSNLGGENRQINSTGTVGSIIRKVKISVDKVTLNVNVSSWREVADF